MPLTVLVTGAAGYIGPHCCRRLAADGHRIVAVDSLVRGHRHALRWGDFVHADLRDRRALDTAFSAHGPVDAVIHFAALAYVGESMREPERYFAVNVGGTLELLAAMDRHQVRHLVFSSTCATYGEPERQPISEDTAQRPVNPYGASKLMAEQAIAAYGRAVGLRWACLRYFNVAGCAEDGSLGEEHEPETHLIPLALAAADGGPPLTVMGHDYPTADGTAVRDYIHVCDLVDAHVRMLEQLRCGAIDRAAVNLGTGQGTSVAEIIAAVERVTGRAVAHRRADRRPGDPPCLVADPRRAGAELGWTARYRLDDMIAHAWAFRLRHTGRGSLVRTRS